MAPTLVQYARQLVRQVGASGWLGRQWVKGPEVRSKQVQVQQKFVEGGPLPANAGMVTLWITGRVQAAPMTIAPLRIASRRFSLAIGCSSSTVASRDRSC